jgi:hypothetical protein
MLPSKTPVTYMRPGLPWVLASRPTSRERSWVCSWPHDPATSQWNPYGGIEPRVGAKPGQVLFSSSGEGLVSIPPCLEASPLLLRAVFQTFLRGRFIAAAAAIEGTTHQTAQLLIVSDHGRNQVGEQRWDQEAHVVPIVE